MKYVKINLEKNPIVQISTDYIEFKRSKNMRTFFVKKWNGIILWKVCKDGVYLHSECAQAYGFIKK